MRCKACNGVMRAHDIIWHESTKSFDDCCHKCKSVEGVREYLAENKSLEDNEEDKIDDDATQEGT